MQTLQHIAKKLMMKGKGILAADESTGTCDERFDKYGIPKTPEMRRTWRELLFTTPDIEKRLSGIILFDETIRQKTNRGVPFAEFLAKRGILPGIKVDQKTEPFNSVQGKPFTVSSLKPLAGSSQEEVTKGLGGLPERLAEYVKFGATFTKWRAVIRIGAGLPTENCIRENARRLAAYAKESQEAGLVPILEPEVLLDGNHSFVRFEEVLKQTLTAVFDEVKKAGCELGGLILKTSMVLPGKDSEEKASPELVALSTVRVLKAVVPKEVAGVVFLSGGQTPEKATRNLNAIVLAGRKAKAPWPLSFSFSRALQDPVMAVWSGKDANVKKEQDIFSKRVAETSAAAQGLFAS